VRIQPSFLKIGASAFDVAEKRCDEESLYARRRTSIGRIINIIKIREQIERFFVASAAPDQRIEVIDKALRV
jgi:hypothetical protein